MDELPTQQNLYIRYPNKITTAECQWCKLSIETNTHWIICPNNITILANIINTVTTKYINKYIKEIYQDLISDIGQTIFDYLNIPSHYFSADTNFILQGLIPTTLTTNLFQHLIATDNKIPHSTRLLHKIIQQIYKQIWISWCQQLSTTTSNIISRNTLTNISPIPLEHTHTHNFTTQLAKSKTDD